LESLLDFPLFYSIRHAFAEGKHLDEVPKTLAKDYLYGKPNILVTLLGGHDDGRFMSEHGATLAGLKLANAFVLTTRGVPQLYYGDEIGMTGPDEPTSRADFPGGFPGDKRDAFTKPGRTTEEQDLFEYIRLVAHLHTALEPLQHGELINLYVSGQQYAYARKSKTGVVVVVINNDTQAATIEFDVAPLGLGEGVALSDRVGTGGGARIRSGQLKITVGAREARILTKK
jgi:glycosidase